ncbi:dihydrofolate reductase [Roseateles sp.]|jgi:dihydrofolate reductase|uniref:dihydrofolate reductase n=1 Tax=Roseateles sp. TaxID=1971397 RepID=UPI0037CB6DC9
MTELVLIAAVAHQRAIGRNNDLLIRLPEDMARFKALTLGHTVIMGRKTWDSIPARFRPLPQRRNIVLSRQPGLALPGAEVFASLDRAIAACADEAQVFVMGGAEIYAQALPLADRLELTEIDAAFEADSFFPDWSSSGLEEQGREPRQHRTPEGLDVTYDFVRYQRKQESTQERH